MSALASYYLPGSVALWCAVAFALAALWGYADLARGDESARPFARRAYQLFALALVLAAYVLLLALARRDFRLDYVYQYSGLDLPIRFQMAAFWAGQKGSFMIWLLWGALIGVPLLRCCGKQEAPVMGIYLLAQLGVLFILVRESPFLMLDHAPADGQGLNPLLQDNWMVIHPPIMFIGYALAAVPFAFAMAALLVRDTREWAARAFPWALAGFLVLGCAILMGGYWAYKTLGWGGYWGWDPVENASLIPWILGTALVHGLYLERTRGRFRRMNLILAALVFLSVLYGTFLTRSGVLADFSVHSFVDLGISGWLIALMAVFLALAAWLLGTRLRSVETAPNVDPPLSRGTFLVLSTTSILVAGLVVTLGTSSPLLTRFRDQPAQVGPEFYNRVNFPLALLVTFLLSLVPYLTWKGETPPRELLRKIAPGLVAGLVALGVAFTLGVHSPLHLLFVGLATTALVTNLQKFVAKTRAGGLAAGGGYLAHVGVSILFLGILASSAYDESAKVTLVQGKPVQTGDLTLTFQRFLPRAGELKERAEVDVVRPDGSLWKAYPKIFVNDRTRQLMVNPAIRSSFFADLYVSPMEYDPGEPADRVGRLELAKGESAAIGELEVRFVGFNLEKEGNALAKMASGEQVTIAAMVDVRRGETTQRVEPVFRFSRAGSTEFPPIELAGGGRLALGGINASAGTAQLLFEGLGANAGRPARLSLDVTHKPLVQMVWMGIYVALAGGLLALVGRVRQLQTLAAIGK
ncbi:MAG TPA: cytochrome c biogenesis protein CcsA [Thermoanaerobaculia bacterium]|nr:cytochrome c biogenesis protein CcsA [Thermoanaerobaculia bacterium]